MLLRLFLPLALLLTLGVYFAWKWGRLYCGWLCPHFSVVEMINSLMRRAHGKLSIWENNPLPEVQRDGTQIQPNKRWWLVTVVAVLFFFFPLGGCSAHLPAAA
ncbi:MAG: 4Fe-4S binding protein [Candidatus Thiodiazotropha sp.]